MVKLLSVTPSDKPEKKLQVKLESESGREKNIHIGAKGMDDFTKTKDEEQKQRYLDRHRAKEDWRLSGLMTAGFWSRYLLWNKPSLSASVADVKRRFGV
jgi:hypothetical protein